MKKSIIISVLALTVLASCKDKKAPVITIKEPSKSEYLLDANMTAVVPIVVEITDNKELHKIHVELYNESDSKEEMHLHFHPDASEFSIDTSFTASGSAYVHKDMVLKVEAEDHNGNVSTAEFHTHIHHQ